MPRPDTDNTELSAELIAAKARMRLLMGFLVLVVLILCGYFYWVSQELNRIQSPSMLINPSSSPEALPLKPRSAIVPNTLVAQAEEAETPSFPSHMEQEKISAPTAPHPFSSKVLTEIDEQMAVKPEHLMLYAPIVQSAVISTALKPIDVEKKTADVNISTVAKVDVRKNKVLAVHEEDQAMRLPVIHIRVEQGYAHKGDEVEMDSPEESFSRESVHSAIGESNE